MIDQLKPGAVIEVPLWRDGAIAKVNVELLSNLFVWFYDGTNLEAPPVKGLATVEEALRTVHARYPSAHFASSLTADHVRPVDDAMERDTLSIVIPFYESETAAREDAIRVPELQTDASAGVIEWIAKLRN